MNRQNRQKPINKKQQGNKNPMLFKDKKN